MELNYETIKAMEDRLSVLELTLNQLIVELKNKKLLPKDEETKE